MIPEHIRLHPACRSTFKPLGDLQQPVQLRQSRPFWGNFSVSVILVLAKEDNIPVLNPA